jgi:hypothetical protein
VRGNKLFAEYQLFRDQAQGARDQAFQALSGLVHERVRAWRDARSYVRSVGSSSRWAHLTALGQREAKARVRAELQQTPRDGLQEIKNWKANQKAEIEKNHQLPTFMGWLQTQAAGDNTEALAYLREREARQHRAVAELAATIDEQKARTVVYAALRPTARKNGQVVYRARDGGVVVDEGERVRIDTVTDHAKFLMLSLLADKAQGQPIELDGDATLVGQMVEMAAGKKMALKLADPALERQRNALMGNTSPSPAAAPSAPPTRLKSWLGRLGARPRGRRP